MFTFVFVLINELKQQDMVTFFHLQQQDELIAFPEPDSNPFFSSFSCFVIAHFSLKLQNNVRVGD